MGPIYHHFRYILFFAAVQSLFTLYTPHTKLDPGVRSRCQWPPGASQSLTNGSYEPYEHNIQANSAKEAIMSAHTREISCICLIGAVGLLYLVYASNGGNRES